LGAEIQAELRNRTIESFVANLVERANLNLTPEVFVQTTEEIQKLVSTTLAENDIIDEGIVDLLSSQTRYILEDAQRNVVNRQVLQDLSLDLILAIGEVGPDAFRTGDQIREVTDLASRLQSGEMLSADGTLDTTELAEITRQIEDLFGVRSVASYD